jgi:hypothetical protein
MAKEELDSQYTHYNQRQNLEGSVGDGEDDEETDESFLNHEEELEVPVLSLESRVHFVLQEIPLEFFSLRIGRLTVQFQDFRHHSASVENQESVECENDGRQENVDPRVEPNGIWESEITVSSQLEVQLKGASDNEAEIDIHAQVGLAGYGLDLLGELFLFLSLVRSCSSDFSADLGLSHLLWTRSSFS